MGTELQQNHSAIITMCYCYLKPLCLLLQPKLPDDWGIMSVLSVIMDKHLRWGFPKCFNRIRKQGSMEP
jgi:putative transposase